MRGLRKQAQQPEKKKKKEKKQLQPRKEQNSCPALSSVLVGGRDERHRDLAEPTGRKAREEGRTDARVRRGGGREREIERERERRETGAGF